MISDTHALLLGAFGLLSDRDRWTTGEAHRVVAGKHKFCLIGSIREIAKDDGTPNAAEEHLYNVSKQIYKRSPMSINDNLGYRAAIYTLKVAVETYDLPKSEFTKAMHAAVLKRP